MGTAGLAANPSYCQGTMMAASCKIFGKEGCTIPKRKDRSWAYIQVQTLENSFVSPRSRYPGAGLALSAQGLDDSHTPADPTVQ